MLWQEICDYSVWIDNEFYFTLFFSIFVLPWDNMWCIQGRREFQINLFFFSLKDRSKTHFTSMLYFLAFNTGLSQISPTCSSQLSSYFWPLAIPRIFVWLFSNFPNHFYFLTQNSFFLHWLPCLVDSTSPSSTLSVCFSSSMKFLLEETPLWKVLETKTSFFFLPPFFCVDFLRCCFTETRTSSLLQAKGNYCQKNANPLKAAALLDMLGCYSLTRTVSVCVEEPAAIPVKLSASQHTDSRTTQQLPTELLLWLRTACQPVCLSVCLYVRTFIRVCLLQHSA